MKKIPLTQGQFAKVSDRRYEHYNQWAWCAVFDPKLKTYYAARTDRSSGKQKMVLMHREIAQTPKGMKCDHIDHDTLNNQDDNLRNATNSQNGMNRNVPKNNTSGYKGVSKNGKSWQAYINKDGKRFYLKAHQTAKIAARAYDIAAKEKFGEFAILNFPEDC